MVKQKYFGKHYDLKCLSCGTVYRDIPASIVQRLEDSPRTQELRCSAVCGARGTLQKRDANEGKKDNGMEANWSFVESVVHKKPGTFDVQPTWVSKVKKRV